MLTFGITIPNFIVIFGIRISFVLRQSELTLDFHPLDNVHAEHTKSLPPNCESRQKPIIILLLNVVRCVSFRQIVVVAMWREPVATPVCRQSLCCQPIRVRP